MNDGDWVAGLVLFVLGAIIAALALLVVAIWKMHLVFGRALVIVVRDWPLRVFWRDEYSDRAVRALILIWLVGVPFLLLLICLPASFSPLISFLLKTRAKFLTFPSIGAILYGYYHYYFTSPITRHHSPRFVKEQYLIKVEVQLAWIDLSTRIKLWFLERVG